MLSESGKRLGNAWLYLTAALILHVLDEVIHNFLDVYLETVFAISAKLPGLPLPIFTVSSWITLLLVLTAFLGFLAVLISWKVHERPREFFAWLLFRRAARAPLQNA